jgi:hypothetical protein
MNRVMEGAMHESNPKTVSNIVFLLMKIFLPNSSEND